jgi:hypothetical protein
MSGQTDWQWKLREAVETIKARYDQIGRKTGAPFLAVVYPPDAEAAVLKEWHVLVSTLQPEFEVRAVNVLDITAAAVDELGCENVVDAMASPMPGSNPETDLAILWINAVAARVRELATHSPGGRPVVVLEALAALYPVAGPRDVMQQLWDSGQCVISCPVVVLIPGTLVERKVYSFLNCRDELMYRGDIL